jgi:hypothetical protein
MGSARLIESATTVQGIKEMAKDGTPVQTIEGKFVCT